MMVRSLPGIRLAEPFKESDAYLIVHFFLVVLTLRYWIVIVFFMLTAAGLYGATHVPNDSAIERLIVPGDPSAQTNREFEHLFPTGDQVLLMLESPDPLSVASLRGMARLEQSLDAIPHVDAHSLLSLVPRPDSVAIINEQDAVRIRQFAAGTSLLRQASLVGDGHLGLALDLHTVNPQERDAALAAIDGLVLPLERAGSPYSAIRRVGSPWLEAWLEQQTTAATRKFMPLFGVFLMTLVFFVYRSWRVLAAIIITLGAVVAIGEGLGDLLGYANSVVSSLVPLTIMVTTTATMVYLHDRYREPDGAPTLVEHHARALANKFLPCTASMFATAVGFAALAVSEIRPIREMGLWTAAGLGFSWIACFTLFPALQSLLRTPVRPISLHANARLVRFVAAWVNITRRYRWVLLCGALLLMAGGVTALLGIPGRLPPLLLETDVLTYVDPSVRVAQDTRRFEQTGGLDVIELWLQTAPGHALDPDFLRAIDRLTERLERQPGIDAVGGPTTILRWAHYIQSGSDRLSADDAEWPGLAGELEHILLTEPGARAYVDVADLASVRLSIRGRGDTFGRAGAMENFVEHRWAEAQETYPVLHGVRGRLAGEGVLSGEITQRLVPTLSESFAITASVIFIAFLVVFRDPMGRLMTMIPSLFAILTVFIIMRAANIPLNIATILIGSTVLGATENDQVHFFYHLEEGHTTDDTSAALQHALLVSGPPIVFATLINASGFVALALSNLPPMRQFGTVSASAFLLALLADFTALPAALWILSSAGRRHQKTHDGQ